MGRESTEISTISKILMGVQNVSLRRTNMHSPYSQAIIKYRMTSVNSEVSSYYSDFGLNP